MGLIARGRDGLEPARLEIEQAGGRALVCVADAADACQVEAAASAIEEEFGAIDISINNAMVSVFSSVKEMTADEFRRGDVSRHVCLTIIATAVSATTPAPRVCSCDTTSPDLASDG